MKTNRTHSIALIALATLSYSLPGLAQTPDAKAGAVVVETQKPVPRAAPKPADGMDKSIIIVGGRSRHVATPTKKAANDTTVPAKTTTTP